MGMEHCRIDTDRGNPKYWEKNLSICHFVHQVESIRRTSFPGPSA